MGGDRLPFFLELFDIFLIEKVPRWLASILRISSLFVTKDSTSVFAIFGPSISKEAMNANSKHLSKPRKSYLFHRLACFVFLFQQKRRV